MRRFLIVILKDKKLIFLHIPKNAGKSVEIFLTGKTVGNPHEKDWRIRNQLAAGKYSDYFSFGVIRNPIDRLMSVFNHYKGGGVGIQHDKNVQRALKNTTFDEFVDQIDEYKGKLISNYMLGNQYRWFFDDDLQIVTKILIFSKLPDNIIEIGKLFDITRGFPWENRSKKFVNIKDVKDSTIIKIYKRYKKDFDVIKGTCRA